MYLHPDGTRLTNLELSKTSGFVKACKVAGIEPTRRQASLFRRKLGLAYKVKSKILKPIG